MFDVAHGAGLAAIWGSWARYVIDSCTPRFAKFAVNVMGVEPGKDDMETGLKGIEAMEDFYRAISMPTNLKELGIDPTEEQLETMAKNARIAAGGPKDPRRSWKRKICLRSIRWLQENSRNLSKSHEENRDAAYLRSSRFSYNTMNPCFYKNVPWHILAPRAVACDSLHLRVSAHLWNSSEFPVT